MTSWTLFWKIICCNNVRHKMMFFPARKNFCLSLPSSWVILVWDTWVLEVLGRPNDEQSNVLLSGTFYSCLPWEQHLRIPNPKERMITSIFIPDGFLNPRSPRKHSLNSLENSKFLQLKKKKKRCFQMITHLSGFPFYSISQSKETSLFW